VGLVTLDTYRIAAVEQLRTYAEIIEVPLRTVLSAGELHQAVHGMRDVDVVLIDTAGRSQNDQPRLNELRTMIAAAGADEVHLLISATANRRCARNVLDRFGSLGATKIVLTKLDEAETYGTILSFSAEPEAPLSFVTTGQDVPDDIEPADPWQLAQRVLKGR
jgi:flagellar biosynthesis protein FlhF